MVERPLPPGFYATEPHQPTYRPPPPPVEVDRSSLLDLGPPRARADGRTPYDARDGQRPVVAVAGFAVLALLAAGTILAASMLHDGGHDVSTPGPASTSRSTSASATGAPSAAQVAASSIDTAITRSVAARKLIGPANTRTGACRATASDVKALNTAASTRTALVRVLDDVDVRALVGGAAVVADLRQAWTYSARADLAYAAWARHHLSCSGHAATHGNPDWDRAHHNDTLSSAAKACAVKTWNPLARRYHLAARTAGAI